MSKAAVKKPNEDALPDSQTIETNLARIRDFSFAEGHGRIVDFFHRLSYRPPQVILIEGGTTQTRLSAADYWLLLLNCPNARVSHNDFQDNQQVNAHQEEGGPSSFARAEENQPCLECPTCIRFATHLHRDCFFLDGTEGSIKIGTLRDEVRPILGEPPREAPYRGVIFHEAHYMTPDAANIMLKSLEEPVSTTSFLLLTPQRERLLPTLVSRSMVLTLPWSTAADGDDAFDDEWEEALCQFLVNGQGLIGKTGQRGSLDIYSGQRVINLCRRKLAQTLSGRPDSGNKSLSDFFSRMPASHRRIVDEVLSQAQDMLLANVSPATVIEWAATRFFLLIPRKR